MAGRRLPTLALVAALLVASAACKRGSEATNGTGTTNLPSVVESTPPTQPTTPPTRAPSYAVPDVIDAAYVETVMKALDQVYGDAVRIMARDRGLNDEFLRYLSALYTERFFELAVEAWGQDVQGGLADLPAEPADPITKVRRLITASKDCITAAVDRDFSGFSEVPIEPDPQRHVSLVPKPADRDRKGLNPTPWIMSYDGFTQTGGVPEDPCRPS